jgi:ribonucleoside-diphosphate reductase alpha chain
VEEKGGFYNCLTTSQAPTGSVSVFLRNIDTGIEPFFALNTQRQVRDAEHGWITCNLRPMELNDLFITHPDLLERTEAQTALKLSPQQQINMLASFQYHNHTGVSKTINVPAETTPEEIEELIYLSRDLRLKGFTVYRDSSLQGIITVGDQKVKKYTDEDSGVANERESRTYTARGHNLKAHITLTNDSKNNIREVFVTAGDVGADINALFAAFGMILSTSLKCEPELFKSLVNSLRKVRMGERIKLITENGETIIGNSLPHIIGEVLQKRKNFLDQGNVKEEVKLSSFDLCPDCQSLTLKRDGSCRKCTNCGFTTC